MGPVTQLGLNPYDLRKKVCTIFVTSILHAKFQVFLVRSSKGWRPLLQADVLDRPMAQQRGSQEGPWSTLGKGIRE
jgi:hypothetical protein